MKHYTYVGPEEIRARVSPTGTPIGSVDDLRAWVVAHDADREHGTVPATFTVQPDGMLRIAPRRSEHVACAGGESVLSAGELFLVANAVEGASNQSTGYCPEPICWVALAAALDRAGIPHPGKFTIEVTFRRCTSCGERNLVKDDWYTCAICDAELPRDWNF
ncbi:MAG: hypothetical protein H0V17_19105 [Deltaproteobacteria bacterium]|nr:hypothetical protein [Deltaproteobacteria bacterium]